MARDVTFRWLSDTRSYKKGVAEVQAGAREIESTFSKVSTNVAGFSAKAFTQLVGVNAVSQAITSAARFAVDAISEQQKALAQTEAVIRSTGGAANVSAKQFADMADELANLSGIDDEVIQGGENMLATFTNIRNQVGDGNNIFDQATKAVLDMSVALGEDVTGSAMRLGKALNDPIAGITALRRVGVQLTDQQEAQIKAFVSMGDTMSAQKVIIAEVNREFGGSAEAFGKTLPGAIGRARKAAEDWAATVAEKAIPAIEKLIDTIGPPLAKAAEVVGSTLSKVGRFLVDNKGYVIALAAVYTATLIPALLETAVAFAATSWARIVTAISGLIGGVQTLAYAYTGLTLSATAAAAAITGIGVVVVGGLGYLINYFSKGKKAAQEFRQELEAGHDTTTFEGNLEKAQAALDALADLNEKYANSTNNFYKQGKLKPLINEAQEAADEAVSSIHNINMAVSALSEQFGLTRAQIIAFAKAQDIDLTQAGDKVIDSFSDQYQAALTAAKGFGIVGLSLEDAAKMQEHLADVFKDAMNPVSVYSEGLQDANAAITASNKEAMDALEERHKAERDNIEETLKTTKLYGDETLAYQYLSADKQKELKDQALADLAVKQEAEKQAAEQAQANTKKTTLGMEEYRRLVEANTKATKDWIKNLGVIGAREGGGAFVSQLADLGPEAAGLVAEIAKSSKPEFDKFAKTMGDASEDSVELVKEKFRNLPDALGVIGGSAGKTMADRILAELANGLANVDQVVAYAASLSNFYAGAAEGAPILPGQGIPSFHAEGHVAQVAPPGSWRVWAEPETGGEAYIPLAMSKRARSTALLGQVASSFGYGLSRMAAGGTWGVPAGVGPGQDSRRAMRAGREVTVTNVFNEKVDPAHVARKIAWSLAS